MRSILGGLFWYVHTLSNIGCGPKQYYGLEVRSTKSDLTEGEAPKVVLGIGFSYWGNRPTGSLSLFCLLRVRRPLQSLPTMFRLLYTLILRRP
jgi:hypothetical protein